MIGIDEVGRGCLAGPLLVVAARDKVELPPGLRDSKLMSRKARQEMLNKLSICCDHGEGWVSAAEINKLGLAKALRLGVRRSLRNLGAESTEEIIMDGICDYMPAKFSNRRCEARADNTYPIVSAASIIAKVARDSYMERLAKRHPNFGFENHVGYGTAEHFLALQKFGPIKHVHRIIFAPFREPITQ